MNDHRITLADGRTMAFTDIGDPDGTPVMIFHGAPSSRTFPALLHEELEARRIRAITPDRPGYGESDPHPHRTLDDWPSDVAQLADALGIESFTTLGYSSGVPYTIATSSRLPDRVTGAVAVAGPTNPARLDPMTGLPEIELDIMTQPSENAAIQWCEDRFGPDGSRFGEHDPYAFSDPDLEYLDDETVVTHFERVTEHAFQQGITGFAQDVYLQGQPWPFDPREIETPTHVVHGTADDIVDVTHSHHTAELIPNATLIQLPGHGHVSIIDEFPRLVAGLVDEAE